MMIPRFLGALLSVALLGAAAQRAAPKAPSVIAHRGASWDAPEHTFAAWDLALAQGAEWIEQDLQLTRDGVLVVLHDDSLDRTARGPASLCTGLVRERSFAELRQCEVGSWFNDKFPDRARAVFTSERIRSLEEVLTRYGDRAQFYIETKNPEEAPGMEEQLVALLRARGLIAGDGRTDRVIVQSFSRASLERLQRLAPALPRVLLLDALPVGGPLASLMEDWAKVAQGVGPNWRLVSDSLVRAAHERGLLVHPYTVNTPALMTRLMALGVDGMFTDRPGLLRSLRLSDQGDGAGVDRDVTDLPAVGHEDGLSHPDEPAALMQVVAHPLHRREEDHPAE